MTEMLKLTFGDYYLIWIELLVNHETIFSTCSNLSLKIQQAWSKLLLKFVSDNNQLWQQQSHFLDCKQSVACGQKTNSTLERIKAQCGYDATLRWPSLWWWLSHLSTTQPPVRSFFFSKSLGDILPPSFQMHMRFKLL